ncbi:SDR family oxidoreductase [Sphingomonas sp. 2SG]|uniref:SDR family oxidoreductase n=1 Tax=Sphingomonas sp. 2SG TaxID=2502201 RepID=UPI0010F8E697|nr:SDR family oxidoreductase [Sphingomonas sp. 2SG]
MHVFVTGATGWVGSALVEDLLSAGHQVTGLARTPDKARALADKGARIIAGSIDDHDLLRTAAADADAVAHTAFNHDWAHFAESAGQDERAIMALGAGLGGTRKPLLVTAGASGLAKGRPATEEDLADPASVRRSEAAAQTLAGRGVNVATVRLPPTVHGVGETHGFVPILIKRARETGVSAYIGDGDNRWSAVHRRDAARLFLTVLERGIEAPVYHAIAEDGVAFRRIAEAIGRQLGLPAESREADHFGWFARMAGGDAAASSERTRALTGWNPTGPDLLTDLADRGYYAG